MISYCDLLRLRISRSGVRISPGAPHQAVRSSRRMRRSPAIQRKAVFSLLSVSAANGSLNSPPCTNPTRGRLQPFNPSEHRTPPTPPTHPPSHHIPSPSQPHTTSPL